MKRFPTTLFWCGMAVLALVGGCSSQSNTSREFEEQIRAPKGPPPPGAVEAMKKIQEAEAQGKPVDATGNSAK